MFKHLAKWGKYGKGEDGDVDIDSDESDDEAVLNGEADGSEHDSDGSEIHSNSSDSDSEESVDIGDLLNQDEEADAQLS
jgi:hypothetical protein